MLQRSLVRLSSGVTVRRPNTKASGELSEMEVFVALTRAGYTVLVAPFSDNQRYDCVVDDGTRLLRVQVKTGRITERWPGVVNFSARSTNWHARTSASYHGAADLFAVWCPENGKVYLVPVDGCGRREVKLRLLPSENAQSKRIRWAADYELTAPESARTRSTRTNQTAADAALR